MHWFSRLRLGPPSYLLPPPSVTPPPPPRSWISGPLAAQSLVYREAAHPGCACYLVLVAKGIWPPQWPQSLDVHRLLWKVLSHYCRQSLPYLSNPLYLDTWRATPSTRRLGGHSEDHIGLRFPRVLHGRAAYWYLLKIQIPGSQADT